MKLKHLLRTVLPLVALATAVWAFGETGRLYSSDKLSSSLINCTVQDGYGYIWVGSDFGLSRFDGYHFNQYLHEDEDTTSIADDIVTCFLVDKQKRLWIGCARGLMQYDYHENVFHRYPFPDHRAPRVYTLIENHKGDILIGSAGYGLYSVRAHTDKIVREMAYTPKDSDLFYTHLFEDNRGNLWQSSHLSDFYLFKKTPRGVKRFSFISPCGAPVAFFQERRNQLLIVCMFGMLYYDMQTGKLSEADFDFGEWKGNITINAATLDHLGNLYLGTSECGVLIVKAGSKTVKAYETQNDQRFDLSTAWVNSIMEDKDQNLWVGCYKKGLYLINNQKEVFNTWNFSSQNFVIGNGVSSMANDDGGGLWCVVQNSGVFRFDDNGKIVAHPQSPAGTSIIYRDRQGQYWIGTGNALYSYQPETGNRQLKLRFASAGIYSIIDDGKGKLYVSVYSKGLYIYDTKSGQTQVLQSSMKGPHGSLCNDWIRSMMFDHTGMLWIGTANGVVCLDPTTMRFDTFNWKYLLRDYQTNAICEDQQGNIVMGTNKGLFVYDPRKQSVKPFPKAEGLRKVQICAIVKDRHGDLWISTTRGIWCYDEERKQFLTYTRGNGLKGSEYVLGAYLAMPDGRIGFGTPEGITLFNPDDVRNSMLEVGKVWLSKFAVDGNPMDCREKKFDVSYKHNTVSMEFSLMNYKNTDAVAYLYRVNNGAWTSTAEGDNTVQFSNLTPGNYRLEVKASINGLCSQEPTVVLFHVSTPIYASPLAIFLYFFLFLALLALLVWVYMRKRKADLEEQKMQFLINATHDIRSPLTLIMGLLDKFKHKMKDSEDQSDFKAIDRNARRLLYLVNEILDERKIDKNQMKLHCRKTDIVPFVGDIIQLHQPYASERNLKIRLLVDGKEVTQKQPRQIMVWIDHENFDKVVSNLLSNALKYSFDDGNIDVLITSNQQWMELRVEDEGIGLKNGTTDKLFERFYRENSDIEGTGIGLNLCKNIVEMHGGRIRAYNRADGKRGACFEVNIPLGKNHLKPEEIIEDDEEELKIEPRSKQGNKNIKVLLVDDDFEIIRYIKDELGQWYNFDYALNGKEALQKLFDKKFDLVVSDIMMPVMDGIELLRKMKSNTRFTDIPVILLTSKREVESRLEGLRRGADGYLAKPFNIQELHILIDNLIDNVRRLRGKFSGSQEQADKVENLEVKGNNEQLMERIMKCLNENLGNPDFNIEKLTEEVGISRAQLHRKMKEITGISTSDFIRNMRLEQAARLLTEGEVNVTQVAYAVGFSNQAHFSTVFRKHFGISPTEYAKQHAQDKDNEPSNP